MLINYELEELNIYKDAHTIWKIQEIRNNNINLFNDLEIHIVEMPKVLKYNKTDKKLKRWIEFILNPESEESKMSIQEDTAIRKAYYRLEEISDDPHLQRIEELKMKKILDDNSVRNHLTKEGKREGKKEKAIEIAKKLLLDGMKPKKVSEITGLTIEEIEKL